MSNNSILNLQLLFNWNLLKIYILVKQNIWSDHIIRLSLYSFSVEKEELSMRVHETFLNYQIYKKSHCVHQLCWYFEIHILVRFKVMMFMVLTTTCFLPSPHPLPVLINFVSRSWTVVLWKYPCPQIEVIRLVSVLVFINV